MFELRKALRWRIATLLDKLPGQCWADLVFWAHGDRRWPWSPMMSTCRADFERCGACWCGKLRQSAERDVGGDLVVSGDG